MATPALDKMSLKELMDLETRVKKAIATARDRERSNLKSKIDQIVANAGLSREEMAELYGFAKGRGGRKGGKVAPKYRNPDNKIETWTGRGRQPLWLVARLKRGGKLVDFAI